MFPCRDEFVTGLWVVKDGRFDINQQRPANPHPLHEISRNLFIRPVALKVIQYWIEQAIDDMLRTTKKLNKLIGITIGIPLHDDGIYHIM